MTRGLQANEELSSLVRSGDLRDGMVQETNTFLTTMKLKGLLKDIPGTFSYQSFVATFPDLNGNHHWSPNPTGSQSLGEEISLASTDMLCYLPDALCHSPPP
jgi:hypothetical protein